VLARRAEQAGVRMITVHGRTRCQFYGGRADWAAIRAVQQAVSVPVIANGDAASLDDIRPMLEQSGADGIMIGRGAYGRPWLPGHIARHVATGVLPEHPPLAEVAMRHYEALLDHYGAFLGGRVARKHLGWYMDQAPAGNPALRRAVLTAARPAEVRRHLAAWFAAGMERSAA
jgi:tRNA-dihydrouridine synthase